jgi:hypothetical protein
LANDQVVLLAITPARDITMLKAVLFAHGLADLGARVGHGLVMLLEPMLPEPDAGSDVQHAFQLEPIPTCEPDHETGKVCVFFRANHASLRGFVEAVVVRLIESTEPIHGRQSNSKGRGDSDALANALSSSGWSHGL